MFRPAVSISRNAKRHIVQADTAANVSHLLCGIRSSIFSIEERLTAQCKRLDEIYSELSIVKTPQLDTDTDEKVDFIPAKSEEELKLVVKEIQVCLYLLCFDIILLKLNFLWRKN